MSRVGKRIITLKSVKELLEGIINKKTDRKKAREMYNNIIDDENELNKLRLTDSRKKILSIFVQLIK